MMRSRTNPNTSMKPPTKKDFVELSGIWSFTKPYRTGLILAGLFSLVSTAFNLIFPQVVGKLIDSTFLEANISQLNRYLGILLLVFAGQAIFTGLQSYMVSRAGEGVVADLRKKLYGHILTLSPSFFEKNKTGDITSRLTSDISTVQTVASSTLVQIFTQPLILVATMTVLFFTNWKLTLLILSVVPAVAVVSIVIGRQIRRVSKDVQNKVAESNARAAETISGIRVVQSFTAEPREEDTYKILVGQSFAMAMQRAKYSAFLTPIIFFLGFGSLALVLWFGARLVANKEIAVGQLFTFVLYTLNVATTVATFSGIFSQIQAALGASARIFEILEEKSEVVDPVDPKHFHDIAGFVDIENVRFSYPNRDEVLRGLTLKAEPGQVVAVVGSSGAGKSTLVSLLPRFYDVSSGVIRIDGIDIREVSLHDLRSQIGIVPQDTLLFSGTILENIRYGSPDKVETDALEAARQANAHNFISEFPDGYSTLVGERGVMLSGGQRQRVAIARALLKNPKILILDEATSALDSESEVLVQQALETLMKGRTTFVIAHRLSTIRNADVIVVLDKGVIVQQGTHEALLAQGGLYKDLYDLQFRD